MEGIKEILKEHDIAGFIILHTPGFTEYLNKINPSYSCAYMDDLEGGMRVKLKAADLPGGKAEAKKFAEDTWDMVVNMTEMIVVHADGYMRFEDMLRKHWGGESGGSTHTSHSSQNT